MKRSFCGVLVAILPLVSIAEPRPMRDISARWRCAFEGDSLPNEDPNGIVCSSPKQCQIKTIPRYDQWELYIHLDTNSAFVGHESAYTEIRTQTPPQNRTVSSTYEAQLVHVSEYFQRSVRPFVEPDTYITYVVGELMYDGIVDIHNDLFSLTITNNGRHALWHRLTSNHGQPYSEVAVGACHPE